MLPHTAELWREDVITLGELLLAFLATFVPCGEIKEHLWGRLSSSVVYRLMRI